MSTPLKIGFVGVGAMGQAAHLRNYVSIPECEVVALAEIRPDLAKKVAARYGIPRVYLNYEEMLANEKLDGIVASQPFTRHGLILPELAKSGLPLFSEKPIASSVSSGEKIVAALEKYRTWLMVGYHKRSDPAIVYAKSEIERLKKSGEVGKLRYIRLLMPPGDWIASGFNDNVTGNDPDVSLELDPPPSDMDVDTFKAYTSFVNFYIHQINLARHLLGEAYELSYADPKGIVLVGHSASGIPVTLEMAPYWTSVDWQESIFVAFDQGHIKVELPAPLAYNRCGRVEVMTDPSKGVTPQTITPTLPFVHAMRNQALNFLKAIRKEAPAPCLAAEALEDLKMARHYIHLLKGV